MSDTDATLADQSLVCFYFHCQTGSGDCSLFLKPHCRPNGRMSALKAAVVGWLVTYRPSNMLVYLRDGSAQR